MAQRDITDEREYLEDRRAWRERGLSRRELLRAGAAGALLLGAGGVRLPDALAQAPAAADRQAAPAGVVHPDRHERRDALGGDGRAGLPDPDDALLRPQPHGDAADRPAHLAAAGVRVGPAAAGGRRAQPARPARAAVGAADRVHRVRRQRAQLLREPAGHARDRLAVGAGRGRRRRVARRAARRGARAGGDLARAPSTCCPRGSTRPWSATASTRATSAGRSRSARRSTTCCVAYEMNGEPLPPDHGAPARLVVPGWVGIASIKWLGRIEVADRPLFSPWNTTQYRMTGGDYPADSPPLTAQQVKSAFELPLGATLPAGRRLVLHGRSWSGDDRDPAGRRPDRRRPARRHAPRPPPRAERPARVGALDRRLAAARPRRATRCWRARPTGPGRRSPTRCRSTTNGYQFWAVVRHPVTVA